MPVGLPEIDKTIMVAKSALNTLSDVVEAPSCTNFAVYLVGNGAVSAGAVQMEEAHDSAYTGTWVALGTPTTLVGNGLAVIKLDKVSKAIRARISTAVTGGTVTVYIVGK